ncbi:SH3 domain-containing protein [Viridibacillus arvi]|uniref:SH3 domain-containing protein n=1 Tax=Viridibacillus arvi TaxID=263475 RepID=UPI00187B523C|nr:G5 domain-containing protein [Viridibacillus sp. JNUCC-6]QOV10948.1 G5 domain-containing protein [Viridibacillus sp. JNUCC-6]
MYIKKSIKLFLLSIFTITFLMYISTSNASAELNRLDYDYKSTCSMVIDKSKNNITKNQPDAQPTGECKKYTSGYYFKDKWDTFYSINGWGSKNVKYSGEPFIINGNIKMVVYRIDSSKKLKKNTVMHIAKDKKINIRKTASSKGKIVTSIKQDNTVKVKKVSGSWVQVIANNKIGWVPRKYLVDQVTVNEVVNSTIKKKITKKTTDSLLIGQTKVAIAGQNGEKTTVYKTKYKNGKKINKKVAFTEIEKPVINSVVYVGTRESFLNK